jgi:conjugative transposon TraM protein
MMEQKHSAQLLRKRKFLLVLPMLVLPFVTLAFWSLGGGTGLNEPAEMMVEHELNATVPDANFKKEKPMDKMQAYAIADRDSSRLEKMMKLDPYYRAYVDTDKDAAVSEELRPRSIVLNKAKSAAGKESHLLEKLEGLQQALASEEPAQQPPVISMPAPVEPTTDKMLAMIDKLNTSESAGDPQMLQLNQMLDKIMAIQQKESGVAGDHTGVDSAGRNDAVQGVTQEEDAIETPGVTVTSNRFWGLEDEEDNQNSNEGIRAVIPEEQTIVNGATVKLRLTTDVYLGKVMMKAGEYVYGKTSLSNERLQVEIPTVKTAKGIIAVKWKIYDMDGLEGIYAPGSIDRDVIQQSAGNGLQSFDLIGGINPSLPVQAASLGIQTAKSLMGKKAKLVKLHLKPGYQVLIRDMAGK